MGLLTNVRIVDFSRLLPGAAMTQLLADLGADVIKIERPGGGDDVRRAGVPAGGTTAIHQFLDRGKRSVALDMATPAGREAASRIIATADAVVESFRPEVAERLGIGYKALAADQPQLVYCSVNGYGEDGPRARSAGHDLNYCACAGVLHFGGWREEGPHPLGVQVADVTGGTVAAVGLLAALISARASGTGTHIQVALADVALWTVGIHVSNFLSGGPQGPRTAELNGGLAGYDIYECADGRHLAVGALEPKFWEALVAEIGRPDLASRRAEPAADDELRAVFRERSLAEWVSALAGTDACVAPVQRFDELASDEQFDHNGMLIEVPVGSGHVRQVSMPFHGPNLRSPSRPAPATVGQHTAEVLAECEMEAGRRVTPD